MTTHILVAGAETDNVILVKEAVANLDYQVIPAPSMSLALFLAQKNLPELVICDLRLVDGDPMSFLLELHSDDELKQIPFMLVTKQDVPEAEAKRFMAAGAALVLGSDIDAKELLNTIEPYIEARLASKEERVIETSE